MAEQLVQRSKSRRAQVDWRAVGMLAAIFLVIALLWGTFVVTPLKIFVVLLHEVSHGVAAWLTGGSIVRIEVDVLQGGVCYTQGGSRLITLSAGYLGSMAWGALILIGAARTRHDRWISMAIGAFLLVLTLLFVRSWFGFGFALLFSVGMIVVGWKLSERVNDLLLKVIGMTSCMYAILDIVDDVLRRPGIGSDADMLAGLTGIPSLLWGVLWIMLALVATAGSLWLAARGDGGKKAQG